MKKIVAGTVISAIMVAFPAQAAGQEYIDEIIVTGTNIKRSSFSDLASPVQNVGKDDFDSIGAKNLQDVIDTLTINTGSQGNSDIFTAGYTTGTSNINLRGLGVASTLVLLNGRRTAVSSVPTTDGVLFVDTNSLVPNIAVDRLEVLKDGASAIYGSEAVAGVANFITRDTFEGLELSTEYQFRVSDGDQEDMKFEALAGVEGDWGNMIVAASYLNRTPLWGDEPDWLFAAEGTTNTSGVGSPGTFLGVSAAAAAAAGAQQFGPFTPDPQCEELGGILRNVCRFDFHSQQTVVPDESRLQIFAKYRNDFSDSLSGYLEFSVARNRAGRNTSPSYPFILDTALVPEDAPFNIFGEEIRYFGRPLGSGQPAVQNRFQNDTSRFSGGLSGTLSESFGWEVSLTHGISKGSVAQSDTITDNFIFSVQGFGGIDCPVRSRAEADLAGVIPGDNSAGCFYWNPFGSALDGSGLRNGEEVRDYIFGEQLLEATSKTTVGDFILSGDTGIDLGGGIAGFAFGAQYRTESLKHGYDPVSEQNGFSFLVGNPGFEGARDAWAVFGEVALPITDDIEIQAALRYETIEDLDTLDPKIGLRWKATDGATLRGSYSTSFRAPSSFQFFGTQTIFDQVSFNGSTNFISVRSVGGETLVPETSTAFNVGATFDSGTLEVSIDYTNFSFEDVLTQENPQAIIDRSKDPANDPKIILTSGGTVGQILADFVNASSIDTSTIDLSANYTFATGFGEITPFIDGTYILEYDLVDQFGVEIEGSGSRNFRNFGDPTPELRFNTGVSLRSGRHSANVFARYVDGLDNDEHNNEKVDSMLTFDGQYNLTIDNGVPGSEEMVFTLGVINAFDEDPPFVFTNGNYESRAYDPRGRRVYARIKTHF